LSEYAAFPDERFRETVFAIDVIPREFSFDTGRDAVYRSFERFDLQNVSILGPHIEAATDAAISADCFGATNARLSHRFFCFGDAHDRSKTSLGLEPFHELDHAVERGFGQSGQETCVAQHRRFHQGVARADGYAMTTRH